VRIVQISILLFCLGFNSGSSIFLEQENVVYQEFALEHFVSSLHDIENGSKQKISIVHIGDSHIQADFLTGQTRKLFQERFGNAGRGFVFPYKIAKSWGPLDVKFNYTGNWKHSTILSTTSSLNLGAAGFTVAGSGESQFTLKTKDDNTDYSFNKITLFNSNGRFVPYQASTGFRLESEDSTTVIHFDKAIDSTDLKVENESILTELQGMILENGETGVLYHSLGINGTGVLQYLRSDFEKNIQQMSPDLVILSFGTNDCYASSTRFCIACNKTRYNNLITRVKEAYPEASILITTPPDSYWLRKYRNGNLTQYKDMLYEIATEEQVALWDLYGIMGGKSSIKSWVDAGLARRDLIHFTQEGYILQGELLYQALIQAYDKH
jgi:lysophospholipase L1-like esterase